MTTIAQVKEVVQPLLQHNPDLVVVGRRVFIKPIQHILRGISLGRSLDPKMFIPAWAVVFPFEPRDSLSLNWGERIYKVHWDVTDPELPIHLREAVEEQALPRLRRIKTIEDFVRFATKRRFPLTYLDLYEHHKIFVDIARGDLESARLICEYMATDIAKQRYLPMKMDEEYDRITKELCPLIARNDRAALARLLHKYEEGTIRKMKLEKYWEPTPFPIELEA
jgi:hypothetical protein